MPLTEELPEMLNVLAAMAAWTFGLSKWITLPSVRIMLTSSTPGMWLTPSFFRVLISFLSSVAVLL